MSEDQLKKCIIDNLHTVHDDLLHAMMAMERLLTLFGEDMSWYENWRKNKEAKI
jgi:hypothetical protein